MQRIPTTETELWQRDACAAVNEATGRLITIRSVAAAALAGQGVRVLQPAVQPWNGRTEVPVLDTALRLPNGRPLPAHVAPMRAISRHGPVRPLFPE